MMWYSNYCDLQSRVALTYCYSFAVGSSVGKGAVFSLQAGHDKGIDFLKTYKITDQHASTPDCTTKIHRPARPCRTQKHHAHQNNRESQQYRSDNKTQIFKTEKILLKLAEIMPLETDRTKQRHTTQKKKKKTDALFACRLQKLSRTACNLVSRVLHSLNLVQKDPKITKNTVLRSKNKSTWPFTHGDWHPLRVRAMPKWCNLNLKSRP